MRTLALIATTAFVLALPCPLWAQEEGPVLPGGGEEAAPAKPEENGQALRERKKQFMENFDRRLSDVRKEETSPERKEIARLEDLKKDYQGNLRTSEEELDRSKQVVLTSFKELVERNKDRTDVESRCESIWLDYMRQSRDKKTAIFEYKAAVKGLDRRINFLRKREVERDLPGLNYQKYYTVDNLEVYGEDEGLDFNVFGEKKSHVSYYALLKEFVLEMSGKGRGDDGAVEKWVEEPPLVTKFKEWQRRAAREPAKSAE